MSLRLLPLLAPMLLPHPVHSLQLHLTRILLLHLVNTLLHLLITCPSIFWLWSALWCLSGSRP